MRLYESNTAKSIILTLLRWEPVRQAAQSTIELRKTFTALIYQEEEDTEPNKTEAEKEFLEEFWEFVEENLKKKGEGKSV